MKADKIFLGKCHGEGVTTVQVFVSSLSLSLESGLPKKLIDGMVTFKSSFQKMHKVNENASSYAEY